MMRFSSYEIGTYDSTCYEMGTIALLMYGYDNNSYGYDSTCYEMGTIALVMKWVRYHLLWVR